MCVCVCSAFVHKQRCFMHLHFNEDISLPLQKIVLLSSASSSVFFFHLNLFCSYVFTSFRIGVFFLSFDIKSVWFAKVSVHYFIRCRHTCSERSAILISHKVRCIHTWLLKIAHTHTHTQICTRIFPLRCYFLLLHGTKSWAEGW